MFPNNVLQRSSSEAFSEIPHLRRTSWLSLRAGPGQDTCRSISTWVVTCIVTLRLVPSPAFPSHVARLPAPGVMGQVA